MGSQPTPIPRGALGRADLLQALSLAGKDPKRQESMAAVLGFEHIPKKPTIPRRELPETTPPQSAPNPEPEASPPPAASSLTYPYRLESIEQVEQAPSEPVTREVLTEQDQGSWDKQAITPAYPALVPWTRLWPRLREAVAEVYEGKIDLPKLADLLARGRPVKRLPRRRQLAFPAELPVVLDFSDRLTPYWEDWHGLACHLAQRWPKSTRIYRLKNAPPGILRRWSDQDFSLTQLPWPKPQALGVLLVIGDLGMVDAAHPWPRERWEEMLRAYRRRGGRVVCLAPISKHHHSDGLAGLADIVRLSPDSDLRPMKRRQTAEDLPAPTHPALKKLLAMVSMASRVEPPLLRALRECLPEGLGDAGLEGELWCHQHMDTAATACALSPYAVDEWRKQFAALDDGLQKATLDCLRRWHSHLPQAIHHEETLLWRYLADAGKTEQANAEQAKVFFEKVCNTLNADPGQPDRQGSKELLAHFAARHAEWLLPTLGKSQPYLTRLHSAAILAKPELAQGELTAGVNPAAWLHERPAVAPRKLALMLSPDHRLSVLDESVPLHRSQWSRLTPLAYLELSQDALLWRLAAQGETLEYRLWLWQSAHEANAPQLPAITYDDPPPPVFQLHTGNQLLCFQATEQPPWAAALGQDSSGLYAENASGSRHYWLNPRLGSAGQPLPGFWSPPAAPLWANEGWGLDDAGAYADLSVQGVGQRFRWIPPGQFLMGSPKDEPGHRENEAPKHPVVLTEGYWLADTPCTQALWTKVMNDNPSYFQTPDRPVEQVSWDDAQAFIEKLNTLMPELDMALPTEAQWEYACRAGTETALYTGPIEILGANNAPALDAIAWYGGNSGVGFELNNGYDSTGWRDKQYPDSPSGTHPVKRKQANAWGLHDMLGNVWEWCQDGYADDYYSQCVARMERSGIREDRVPEAPHSASSMRAKADAGDTSTATSNDGTSASGDWQNASINPAGPGTGSNRVIRGGSWFNVVGLCRSAIRRRFGPSIRLIDLGFRLSRIGALRSYPFTLFDVKPREIPAYIDGLRDPLADGGAGPAMVWLKGGEFMMGQNDSTYDDEKPAHAVRVGAYSIGQYPVTFEDYDCFCEATGREKPDDRGWGRGKRPVINIHWDDAQAYCAWISGETGEQYRLATEAEWEFACRAGSTTQYCFGDEEAKLADYAWYSANSRSQTHPVGEKLPNAWQLFDMHGNVWEWCADWFADDYYQQCVARMKQSGIRDDRSPEAPHSASFMRATTMPVDASSHWHTAGNTASATGEPLAHASDNPAGPSTGTGRVIRGGSWYDGVGYCRSAFRGRDEPSSRGRNLGFRLSRTGPWRSYPFTLVGGAIAPPRENFEPPVGAPPFDDAQDRHRGDLAAETQESSRREGAAPTTGSTKPRFKDLQVFRDRLEDFGDAQAPAMVYLPGGTFLMGDEHGDTDEKPVHPVKVKAFAIGQTPLTIGDYLEFCQATDSHWPEWLEQGSQYHIATGKDDYYRKRGIKLRTKSLTEKLGLTRSARDGDELDPQCLDLPVVGISWDDALAYCQWLSEQTGETYALPTEAQWEYACRAGNPSRWCFGDDERQLGEYAWYNENAKGKLHPVASKRANDFGLHDVHGLVWEWCQDWYAEDYYSRLASEREQVTSTTGDTASDTGADASNTAASASSDWHNAIEDQAGPGTGSDRVIRGGSWYDVAGGCRSAFRSRNGPLARNLILGFRLSRTV